MLTQEEYVDVVKLRQQGLTLEEIAAEVGYHPATISKWLRDGGPPAKREVSASQRVVDDRWEQRIRELLQENSRLLSTSVFDILVAEGFDGSYPTVVRHVRALRGPRFRSPDVPSVPIETPPGQEAQFDWTDCSAWAARWEWATPVLWCLGVILSWSRWRTWWFTTSTDREHTFEGLVRFFEAAGGVPLEARTDRMGALGASQGRRFRLHPPTVAFAAHHGVTIRPCAAGDAKRKGKIERQFQPLKASFLEELVVTSGIPGGPAELNTLAPAWLDRRVHAVAHRVTGVPPEQRVEAERRLLRPLPRHRFDSDYVEPRTVHPKVPLIEYERVRYSVPPRCRGQVVELRRAVDDDRITIRWAGAIVASHRVAPPGSDDVWDPAHRAEAERAALAAAGGRHLYSVPDPAAVAEVEPPAPVTARLELDGDYDVAPPDLARYGVGCDCAGRWPR